MDIKTLQQQVKDLENIIRNSTKKELSAYTKLTMLTSEVGELADELIALEFVLLDFDKNFLKIDSCLDSGGKWDYNIEVCKYY